MSKIKYESGQKVGHCIYLGGEFSKNWIRHANFKCECGKFFVSTITKVKSGHTKSCGCLGIKKLVNMNTTHGMDHAPEYDTWTNIKQRCTNPNNNRYADWGGRGITICEEWLNSFEVFYKDMGNRPSSRHTLDRIENDKGYYKENCLWRTQKQQSNNRRNNINVLYKGESKTIMEWTEILNLPYERIYQRIQKLKWPPEKAFETVK